MIKSVSVFTYEIDDPMLAIEEVRTQIESVTSVNEKMLGIIMCSYDYVESGVVKAMSEEFPFQIIGETTLSQTVPDESGILMLSMQVFYSDDCSFVAGVTDSLHAPEDLRPMVREAYKKASEKVGEREKLILAFVPLLMNISGEKFNDVLSEVSDNVPLFGSICCDDTPNYEFSYTIFNGEAHKDRLSFVLISGNVSPEFIVAHISRESLLPYSGEVTASHNNILEAINDKPIVEYLETVGLVADGNILPGVKSIPFLINLPNKSGYDPIPVARVLFAVTPDNKAVCGGEMPIGSPITLGTCDMKDVLSTTESLVKDLSAKYPGRSAIMFSCLGRRLSLGVDTLAELETIRKNMYGKLDFFCAYSGGELCPTSVENGVAVNRFHNYTFVVCIL